MNEIFPPYMLVVGSSNTDMVIKAQHLPGPGETIMGDRFFMNPGGKGANQAVAAARLGGNVTFICKTGKDIFGEQAAALFKQEGINTDYLLTDPDQPSGVALITVDANAENCIVVASGANNTLSVGDLTKCKPLIENATLVLMQLEIPLGTVQYVAEIAGKSNVPVILNPAPAAQLPDDLLKHISIITPNETEARILTGVQVRDLESAKQAAVILKGRGIETVIITLGAEGALVLHDNIFLHVPGVKVTAVDTTAAGDVFNGALAASLSQGKEIHWATAYACSAASLSVTRFGAQASAPYHHELS